MAKENVMSSESQEVITFDDFKKEVLNDYRIACESREASLLGRREVLTGKAKFGIFGDGKEVPQLAMAKYFQPGDFRSGYYRDQTFMFATGNLTLQQWFAGLYAHTDLDAEPTSGGRQMGGHFATRSLNPDGTWKDLTKIKNSSADISPTAGQMPRLLGLAQASKVYRHNKLIQSPNKFSNKGNEVAFGTIGDASTSEGLFWETINAAGVLQVPMVISVWDDGHGISVSKKYQTTKESISEVLKGFQREKGTNGLEIFRVKGWDYANLCKTYEKAVAIAREEHVPVLIHVEELTQPQGHSTSGSHERYKSKERLQWELEFDCIKKMREWILTTEFNVDGKKQKIATAEELDAIENNAKKTVKDAKNAAWNAFLADIKLELNQAAQLIENLAVTSANSEVASIKAALTSLIDPLRKDIIAAVKKSLRATRGNDTPAREELKKWLQIAMRQNYNRYSSTLNNETNSSALNVPAIAATYDTEAKLVDGREVLRHNFEKIFTKYPETLVFGEDSGKLGDVNQGLEGMQEKFGELRVSDIGIREATIIGQGIGMAMRGLRPIAEIQYLDYLLYALQIMSDDLATLQYRTKGGQKAPLIVRTRGHRLEGIWHSGSPMGMIIHALRGLHICVPRNMTQAAGMYNTLLRSDDPALIIEPLNGYRLKEKLPNNLGEFCVPLGIPEVLSNGNDITIVSYGSTLRIAQDAVTQLAQVGISAELIDVQTLLPFDIHHSIVESIKKTNRVLFLDEDVEGGASAFMMQQVLEVQEAYKYLDSAPKTLTAKNHRPAYGSDGDYFSKPNAEDIFDAVYSIMHEANPKKFPSIY